MKRVAFYILTFILILNCSTTGMSRQVRKKYSRTRPRTLSRLVGATRGCLTVSTIPGGVIKDEKALSKPAPEYPEEAKAKNISGVVRVRVLIDETGKVVSASALSGPLLLRKAAVDAAYQARFPVTTLSGHVLKVSGAIEYNFKQ